MHKPAVNIRQGRHRKNRFPTHRIDLSEGCIEARGSEIMHVHKANGAAKIKAFPFRVATSKKNTPHPRQTLANPDAMQNSIRDSKALQSSATDTCGAVASTHHLLFAFQQK